MAVLVMYRLWILMTANFLFYLTIVNGLKTLCNGSCCYGFKKIEDECVECKPGFWGWNCSKQCVEGRYGDECRYMCNCSVTEICDFKVGCQSSPISTATDEQEQSVYVADSPHIILLSLVGMANLLIIFIMVECIVLFKQYQKQKTFEKNKENDVHLPDPISRDGVNPDNYMEEDVV